MTIWIDPPRWPAHGRAWSHLISDTSYAELHAFAAATGIPRRGFEGDHYDVPEDRHTAVVAAGARETSGAELVRLLQASGLRLRKRRGEKGVARALGIAFPDGSVADVDLVRSDRLTPDSSTFAAAVNVRDAANNWLIVYSPRRGEWSSPGGWREPGETPIETAVRECTEETGLALETSQLRAVGYERFYPHADWPTTGRFLLILRADLTVTLPALTHASDEPARWVTSAEYAALSANRWWWPLAATILDS